ncbi:MAG: hypothetical protein KGM92_19545, partial [Acidobacteriota bacterium]|nr:hypothetical protein [Acidobacteriota bacterium]
MLAICATVRSITSGQNFRTTPPARHVKLRREESTRVTKLPLPLCFCAAALWAQSPAAPFDVKAMDLSADPCTDFYQYACGSWMKNNPIPADQSHWGRFTELEERN